MLDYWFAGFDRVNAGQEQMKRWYFSGKQGDEEVKQEFEQDLLKIEQGDYRHWLNDKEGALAYIIICDQFTRQVYRGSGLAFSNDAKVVNWSREWARGQAIAPRSAWKVWEQTFISMPLMHSEDPEDGKLCIEVF